MSGRKVKKLALRSHINSTFKGNGSSKKNTESISMTETIDLTDSPKTSGDTEACTEANISQGEGEHVLLSKSFARTEEPGTPRLTRTSTFTIEKRSKTPTKSNIVAKERSVTSSSNDIADVQSSVVSANRKRRSFSSDAMPSETAQKRKSSRKQWNALEKLDDLKLNLTETDLSGSETGTRRNTFTKEDDVFNAPAKRKSIRKQWPRGEELNAYRKSILDLCKSLTEPQETCSTSKTFLQSPIQRRNSISKRWSQIERTPAENISSTNRAAKTNKSVVFRASTTHSTSPKISKNKPRTKKKSVRIADPLNTPTKCPRSPMVVQKTPGAKAVTRESSILCGSFMISVVRSPCLPSTSGTASSTPFNGKEGKKFLKNAFKENVVETRPDDTVKRSRVKMPDFRKIHERHFNKMENIVEHQERKAARANNLMSGTKPFVDNNRTNVARSLSKQSRKKVLFPASSLSNLESIADPSNSLPKPVQEKINKRAFLKKSIGNGTDLKGDSEKTSKVVSKPVKRLVAKKVAVQQPDKKQKANGISRFGFKLSSNQSRTKEDQIKAVTSKSKLSGNSTENNRNFTSSVRMNRRFELLMKMRAKENKK